MTNQPVVKHYVEFLFPGILFSETSEEEVKERIPSCVKAPKGCFGFKFFDRKEFKDGNEVLLGKKFNWSGVYYFGIAMTLEEIKKKVPDSRILVSNLEGYGCTKGVKTRCGNWQPLDKKDIVLKAR